MKVFISGLLNIETTIKVRKFPIDYYPIDYPFFGIDSSVSGVGYNLARAFSGLGDEVSLFSYIGKDTEGQLILKTLEKEGISRERVVPQLARTPVSAILYDDTGRRQVYCDLKDIQEQMAGGEELERRKDADLYLLCNINFNRELIKKARREGKLTASDVHVLDNTEDGYNRDFMENSDILFLSDERLPCPPEEFARRLRDRYHNRIIVIGCGAKGAVLCDETGRTFHLDAVPCENVVNTVGAGDALFAGFLHFYGKGYPALEALIRGEAYASIKIGSNGGAKGFPGEGQTEQEAARKRPAVRETFV